MSSERHSGGEAGALVVTLTDRSGFPTHEHHTHQLAWAPTGILTMGVADRTWVLPRSRALWIPAGTPHDVLAGGQTTMVSLYFDPSRCPIVFSAPTVVDTSGLLGSLIEHLLDADLDAGVRQRAEAVVFDLLAPLDAAAIDLPEPRDDRVTAVGTALRNAPDDDRTLGEWGQQVGASGRTLARAIERDTGMGFGAWRTTIRIHAAIEHLASGMPISRVAPSVGYSSPSAFVAAFRRVTGTTPGRYFATASSTNHVS